MSVESSVEVWFDKLFQGTVAGCTCPKKVERHCLNRPPVFDLYGTEVVERGMAPFGVFEAIDISGNVALSFGAGETALRQKGCDSNVLNNVSTIALS